MDSLHHQTASATSRKPLAMKGGQFYKVAKREFYVFLNPAMGWEQVNSMKSKFMDEPLRHQQFSGSSRALTTSLPKLRSAIMWLNQGQGSNKTIKTVAVWKDKSGPTQWYSTGRENKPAHKSSF